MDPIYEKILSERDRILFFNNISPQQLRVIISKRTEIHLLASYRPDEPIILDGLNVTHICGVQVIVSDSPIDPTVCALL